MKKSSSYFILILIAAISLNLAGCGKQTATIDIEENPSLISEKTVPPVEKTVLDPTEQPADIEDSSSAVSSGGRTLNWYFVRNSNHETPRIASEIDFSLADYDAYYIGSKEKVIFLTFDEGYENGHTPEILDILKTNQVPAAFFVTGTYITANPDLIKRMVNEGHIVGNHSQSHPSLPAKTGDPDAFKREFTDVEDSFREVTGQEMPKYIRPPRGEYNEKSLQMTREQGYKTIFWSFAYQDWLVNQQPDPEESYKKIMQGTHNGQIMLLHAVSSTNTEILDRVIKDIQKEGYRFAPLTEIEKI